MENKEMKLERMLVMKKWWPKLFPQIPWGMILVTDNCLKSQEEEEFTHAWKFITGTMKKYNSNRVWHKKNSY